MTAMSIEQEIEQHVHEVAKSLYGNSEIPTLQVQKTRKEFTGDYTVNVFPLLKISRNNPENTARQIGEELIKTVEYLVAFEIVKGFLNLVVAPSYWNSIFTKISSWQHKIVHI